MDAALNFGQHDCCWWPGAYFAPNDVLHAVKIFLLE